VICRSMLDSEEPPLLSVGSFLGLPVSGWEPVDMESIIAGMVEMTKDHTDQSLEVVGSCGAP
jgi:hypothetical protein